MVCASGSQATSKRATARSLKKSAVVLNLIVAAGCLIVGAREQRIIPLNGGSVQDRLQIAQKYATSGELDLLRSAIRRRFPDATAADLSGVDLSWRRMLLKQEDSIAVVITFTPHSRGLDAGAIADFAADTARTRLSKLEELLPEAPSS
jgi:hypothetical protein